MTTNTEPLTADEANHQLARAVAWFTATRIEWERMEFDDYSTQARTLSNHTDDWTPPLRNFTPDWQEIERNHTDATDQLAELVETCYRAGFRLCKGDDQP